MYSILIVDDEKWVRKALQYTVSKTRLPFEVVKECSNGREALDYLGENQVDLVMSDVRMATMDGLELVVQLAQCSPPQDVIMISGYDDFTYIQQALRAGVFDYLLKPVETEEMKACLDKWLQRRGQAVGSFRKGKMEENIELSPVESVKEYVRNNLSNEITLTEAAARVFFNPSYLSQLFKQQTSKNFVDYVLEERMMEAKRLLESTPLRISDIARRLGYSDLAYFSTVFKKTTGFTPTEFRKARDYTVDPF
jgi:YesN/AraC family two-component response regulator